MDIAVLLIILHTVDGRPIAINPQQITHLGGPKASAGQHFVKGVNCQVNFTDGKFVTVIETCDEIRRLLEQAK